jgi:hypothetical protein
MLADIGFMASGKTHAARQVCHRAPLCGVLLGLGAVAAGCIRQEGTGTTFGTLVIPYCDETARYRSPDGDRPPDDYNLNPTFIAGEPFEDVREPARTNRLVLRLQRSGKRLEYNDVLTFDFVQSYEIARCLAGLSRIDKGAAVPDYDSAACVPTADGTVVRVGVDTALRVHFMPRSTCSGDARGRPMLVATAVSAWPEQWPEKPGVTTRPNVPAKPPEVPPTWESWVHLVTFGDASGWRGKPCADEPCREGRKSFKVEFGQRVLVPSFELAMMDDRYIKRLEDREMVSEPEIRARLVGQFDLDLQRGQGAQTFP